MRKLLVAAVLLVLPAVALADVYVRPYARRDGTYVPGHRRTYPDGVQGNNYGANPGPYNPDKQRTLRRMEEPIRLDRPRRSGGGLM